MAQHYTTRFGSLERYDKGGVEVVNDDARNSSCAGEVEIRLLKLDNPGVVPHGTKGSVALAGTPAGRKMGVVRARRGHMTLLPVGAAYQLHAARPGVILLQTMAGADTVERWGDICQTTPRRSAR